MNYGVPYMGSKNSIAADIVKFLPEAENFYDCFLMRTHKTVSCLRDFYHLPSKISVIKMWRIICLSCDDDDDVNTANTHFKWKRNSLLN